jgi:hypothetical protein
MLLKRKRNGMSFGQSMVADYLLYILALKSYLARLFLQWKTNAFTALLPTSTTNSGQASQRLQLADYLLKKFLSDALKNANVKMDDDLAVIDAIDDFFGISSL